MRLIFSLKFYSEILIYLYNCFLNERVIFLFFACENVKSFSLNEIRPFNRPGGVLRRQTTLSFKSISFFPPNRVSVCFFPHFFAPNPPRHFRFVLRRELSLLKAKYFRFVYVNRRRAFTVENNGNTRETIPCIGWAVFFFWNENRLQSGRERLGFGNRLDARRAQ